MLREEEWRLGSLGKVSMGILFCVGNAPIGRTGIMTTELAEADHEVADINAAGGGDLSVRGTIVAS